MRICVLHRYPLTGALSTNPSLLIFLEALRGEGHDVTLLTLRETADDPAMEGIRNLSLPVSFQRTKGWDKLFKSLIYSILAPIVVAYEHQKLPFDIIYCDDSFPGYGFFAKRLTAARTVIRMGDLQTAYVLASGALSSRWLFPLVHRLEVLSWRSVDSLVAVSEAFKDFITQQGVAEDRVDVVPECVDTSMFTPLQDSGILRRRIGIADEPLATFHGLVSPIKGLDVIIDAASQIVRTNPKVKIAIIGDGPQLPALKQRVSRAGLADSVLFTGWIPFQEMPALIADTDLGIPCRSTNLGNSFVVTTALLQYWAMAKPVVAPAHAAVAEVVREGQNGYLFRPGDPSHLADQLVLAMEHHEQLPELGLRGRELLMQRFGVKRVAQEMVNVLVGANRKLASQAEYAVNRSG